MNINVEQIKINLMTNIPNTQNTEFTSSMIYIPPDPKDKTLSNKNVLLNKYPYFTFDVKYPSAEIMRMKYSDRMNFSSTRTNSSNNYLF